MSLSNLLQKTALYILNKTGYKSDVKKDNDNYQENNSKYKKISLSKCNIIIKKKNLIEKQLHFINIGDKKPYMDLCINSYKYFNDSYKINFLNYNYDDFFKQNNVWNICKKYHFDELKQLNRQQLDTVIWDYKFQFIYTYGGILCSLKSFCVRNLDIILENTNYIYTHICNDIISEDKSIIAIQKGYVDKITNRLYPPCNMDSLDYESIKMAFYRLRLKIDNFQTNNKLMQNYIWSF